MSDTAVHLDLLVLLPSKCPVYIEIELMIGTMHYLLIWLLIYLIIYLGRKLVLSSL